MFRELVIDSNHTCTTFSAWVECDMWIFKKFPLLQATIHPKRHNVLLAKCP